MNSIWKESVKDKFYYDSLDKDINCDVCIICAGIFGITCAYYLDQLGLKVVVIDKDSIGKTTSFTTGKITSQHGLFYSYLYNAFGEKVAKDYLDVNEQAIKNIKDIIVKENISCDFKMQNNYVYTTKPSDLKILQKEQEILEKLDFNSDLVTKVGLPFKIAGSICFKNQAQFNPLKYLYGLCKKISLHGSNIFFNTTAIDIKHFDGTYITHTYNNTISSKYVIVATHYPFLKIPGFYFSKLYQSTSYIIAIDPKKTLFNGMYINMGTPSLSFRTADFNNKKLLLIGGGNHKTGQSISYEESYGYLEYEAKKLYPNCDILYKWNTEDCISLDKLPFIGQYSGLMPNVYVGTGFKKWGMTLSNVAANIIVDNIMGNYNKYTYLFTPSRMKPIKNFKETKNMLTDSANSLIFRKFKNPELYFENIPLNSGGIIEINNSKVGIYKDNDGKIYAVNPICTHLGCLLSWNDIDKTWDCPCHGSRFDYTGKNIYDPAFKNLETY